MSNLFVDNALWARGRGSVDYNPCGPYPPREFLVCINFGSKKESQLYITYIWGNIQCLIKHWLASTYWTLGDDMHLIQIITLVGSMVDKWCPNIHPSDDLNLYMRALIRWLSVGLIRHNLDLDLLIFIMSVLCRWPQSKQHINIIKIYYN